jgi:hypothetical protein
MAWGWDESMHAGLPAARLAAAAQELDAGAAADTLLGCHQYPFVYPVVLAASESAFGITQRTARRTGRAVWALTLWGLFLLVRSAVLSAGRARGKELRGGAFAPWLALAAGAASPLALGLSGTLFLEVPFACAAVFALLAWLARTEPADGSRPSLGRELLAGALVTVAFFTKFNYGLLLGFALALDLVFDFVGALRAGRGGTFLVRCLALAAPVLVAATWWFVLPLPGDLLMGALHREKFLGFVTGNSELARVAWEHRALHWNSSLVASPRAFVLLVIGLLVALHTSFTRGTRTLWLVALVFTVAITAHPFHLDRFLVPGGVVLFAHSAIGLAALLPRSNLARVALAALVGFLVLCSPSTDVEWFAERLGILARDDEPELARYKRSVLAGRQRLSPWRTLPTGGLPAAELDPLVDLVAAEVGPDECPGWIGVSAELPPAAIWLGLLERGWPARTFLRCSDDEPGEHYVTIEGVDPGWSDARLARFAGAQDVIFHTRPVDAKDRGNRAFLAGYRDRLLASGWTSHELGSVPVERPLQSPLRLHLFAARLPARQGQ